MTVRDQWNRCDVCGKFIALEDFYAAPEYGPAIRRLVYPDSEFTRETWETLCMKHSVGTGEEWDCGRAWNKRISIDRALADRERT